MSELLRPVSFAVPGKIDQKTGGYLYDHRIIQALRGADRNTSVLEIGGAHPIPDDIAFTEAALTLAAQPDGSILVIDGLALPAFEPSIRAHAGRIITVALVHHPLALETGLTSDAQIFLMNAERKALSQVAGIITTSTATAALITDNGHPAKTLFVVAPGTDPVPAARGTCDGVLRFLCVGAVIPRKGHADLIAALAGCAGLPWRLLCFGSLDRDPKTAAAVSALIAKAGLAPQVTLAGEADAETLATAYNSADIFVLASSFEGYGMAFAEALARGLPIIGSGDGAVRDTVPASAGIIVPVGDCGALRGALRQVIEDATYRGRLAKGARAIGVSLPDWCMAGQSFGQALDRIAARAS
jgi:glycosyltransferase involved in cell wall biosynthesis